MGTQSSTSRPVSWQKIVRPYTEINYAKSWWQLLSNLSGFIFLWWLAYKAMTISYWLTIGIDFLNVAFLTRLFIIFHDCGHGTFFKTKTMRTIVGYITGLITLSPYHQWSKDHGTHHATSGNLEKRGTGDIWTMTAKEYYESTPWQKFCYRFYRNPFVTFIIGPIYLFIFRFRFTTKNDGPLERRSVYINNALLALVIVGLGYTIGFKTFFMVHLPIQFFSGILGCWLFYVQHQYEDVYWRKGEEWDFADAALQGSSYYKLPKFLEWASGNIGFHHIHHLAHQIPNYNLAKCHAENELFQQSKILSMRESLGTIFLSLYDEDKKRMITFGEYRKNYEHYPVLNTAA